MRVTCEDRIGSHMDSREDQIAEIIHRMSDGDDDAFNEYNEIVLGISEKMVIRIELSTGGPADWIEVAIDSGPRPLDYQIIYMKYHFADWFDHAEREIEEDSYLWRYAEEIVDIYYGSRL